MFGGLKAGCLSAPYKSIGSCAARVPLHPLVGPSGAEDLRAGAAGTQSGNRGSRPSLWAQGIGPDVVMCFNFFFFFFWGGAGLLLLGGGGKEGRRKPLFWGHLCFARYPSLQANGAAVPCIWVSKEMTGSTWNCAISFHPTVVGLTVRAIPAYVMLM